MSRLQSKKNKQLFYKSILILILSISALFLIFTYGFNILINSSLFINQLANSSQSKIQTKKENQLKSIIIDPISEATNSSNLIISGSLLGYNALEFYLNGEKIKEISQISESFSEEISGLIKGENTLYAIAKSSNSKETKKSQVYTVTLKTEKPKLEILSPKDGDKVTKQDITIIGETDKETYIQINSLPVVVDVMGKFRYDIKLKDGENKIEIVAKDMFENIETKLITIQYSKDD